MLECGLLRHVPGRSADHDRQFRLEIDLVGSAAGQDDLAVRCQQRRRRLEKHQRLARRPRPGFFDVRAVVAPDRENVRRVDRRQ